MTGGAVVGGTGMGGALARDDAVVVATDTGALYLRMIHRGRRHRCPGRRPLGMAGIALIGGTDMPDPLPLRHHIIVTDNASGGDLAVVDAVGGHRSPGSRVFVMAGIALIRRRHVIRRLAAGNDGVMTGDAIAEEAAVIDNGNGQPARCDMTGITLQGSRQVCRALAAGSDIVVATAAGAEHLAVVHL